MMTKTTSKESESIFKMQPEGTTANHINSEHAKGNEWLAYNSASFFLTKNDLYFFKNKDEAGEFSKNNISEFDNFRVIKTSSVVDVLRQIPDAEKRFEFFEALIKQVPDNITGHKLDPTEKQTLLLNGKLENLGSYNSGKTLTLVSDPKTNELTLRLSQLVVGKDAHDISEATRLIHQRDIFPGSYTETSGLKKELQDKGIHAPNSLKEPFLFNVLPSEAKDLEKKSSIAEGKGQKYSVINYSATDHVTYHSNLKEAAFLAQHGGGSLIKTKDLKESLAYQKQGGDINITTGYNTPLLKKENKLKIG